MRPLWSLLGFSTRWLILVPGRPRSKIHFPFITFVALANIKTTDLTTSTGAADDYLPSQIPASINLLEPLQSDPALATLQPYLAANRVSRIMPANLIASRLPRRLESTSRQVYQIMPAVNLRIRYSRLSLNPRSQFIIMSVDLEVAALADCEIVVEEVVLWLEDSRRLRQLKSSDLWF